MRLVPAFLAIAVLAPAPVAQAAPDDWLTCSRTAPDMRALRKCSTAQQDIAACERDSSGLSVEGSVQCLNNMVALWTLVAQDEDRRVSADDRPGWNDWIAERDSFCRDADAMRLSAERYGEGHASFEAAKCELQQTVRRAIDSVARQRGLR